MTGVETIARILCEHFQNRKGIKRNARELGGGATRCARCSGPGDRVQLRHQSIEAMTKLKLYGMRARARGRYFNLGDLVKQLEQ